jgi:predicted O-linked N-acetylglucosamine transferase (SPINDLY family)
VLELNHLAGRSNGLALSTAWRLYPQDPGIACHRVLIQLTDRQPALARRSAFQERILHSIGKPCPSYQQSDSNLLAAYDQTGRADLTPYLHPNLQGRLTKSPPLHANFIMQLGSLSSPLYGPYAEEHARTFPSRQMVARPNRERLQNQPLKVGLLSPDFYYHPVGRFVQMLLSAGLGHQGELHLLNTGKPAMPRLQQLAGSRLHNLSQQSPEQRLEQVRQLELDVVVDLAGWTGDNNGQLLARGLAPKQVNYLGYFASSGLSSIDVWLGDDALFPDPMQEWHSEKVVRLPRPFLAWQPDEHLPEGRLAVPPAPAGPIVFGCFNHVRKLSAATLSLWARLLKAIPGARLALKAFTSDDPGVVALLQQRMQRCGLDPSTVFWLPTCPKPEDHLRQYGLIDVALDPFPNGGCTTTCEALWMGVPVISLCGSHYVSRMATAVLQGANLPEWVAQSPEHYLSLGLQAAERLPAIRAGRPALRAHLQASPLGNASDLAHHLWQCFTQLV